MKCLFITIKESVLNEEALTIKIENKARIEYFDKL
jgi:hypothetical protein